jgi:hypothetical protein
MNTKIVFTILFEVEIDAGGYSLSDFQQYLVKSALQKYLKHELKEYSEAASDFTSKESGEPVLTIKVIEEDE